MPQFGGGPKCPVCGKTVYFNEERRALGKVYHVVCFKCAQCKKALDSTNCAEHEDQLFCKNCHRKSFGPSGYGFAGGSAGLSTESGQPGFSAHGQVGGTVNYDDPDHCPVCGKKVFFAEQSLGMGRKFHKMCFKCSDCHKKLDSTSVTEHDHKPYCKGCYGKNFGPSGYGFAGGAAGLSTAAGQPKISSEMPASLQGGSVDFNNPDHCPRCGKKVYFAEQVVAESRNWHRSCFKCSNCNKTLDSTNVTNHEGQLFCKGCYGRNFGPKGVGYGIGAGTLSTN